MLQISQPKIHKRHKCWNKISAGQVPVTSPTASVGRRSFAIPLLKSGMKSSQQHIQKRYQICKNSG